MARPATGSIDELPDGRWRVRVTVGGKRRVLGCWDTEKEAQRRLDAWNSAVSNRAIEAPSGVTLAAYGAEWLDRRELNGSRARAAVRDVDSERSLWRRHVEPSKLGGKTLGDIRPRDVDAFVEWLRTRKKTQAKRVLRDGKMVIERTTLEKRISSQTQRHVMRLVRTCLDEACRAEIIDRNPAEGFTVTVTAKKLDDDWLRPDEIRRLLACAEIPEVDRAFYAFAIGTGLRLNDIKGIELRHVHLDAEQPHVDVRIRKSEQGEDEEVWHRVPILSWLVSWVAPQVARAKGPYLFGNRDGMRYASKDEDFGWSGKKDARSKELPPALARAGIARRIRFHDLRGTTATNLALGTWGRKWAPLEIKAMLFHADLRTTERYIRRANDLLATAAAETTGGIGTFRSEHSANPVRTQEDSNLRPTAPEASVDSVSFPMVAAQPYRNGTECARAVLMGAVRGELDDAAIEALVEHALARPTDEVLDLVIGLDGATRKVSALGLARLVMKGGR
jgi:integrase